MGVADTLLCGGGRLIRFNCAFGMGGSSRHFGVGWGKAVPGSPSVWKGVGVAASSACGRGRLLEPGCWFGGRGTSMYSVWCGNCAAVYLYV